MTPEQIERMKAALIEAWADEIFFLNEGWAAKGEARKLAQQRFNREILGVSE